MDAKFLRRQVVTALRLASQSTDPGVADHLKLVAAELLQEAVNLESPPLVPPAHVIAEVVPPDDDAPVEK